MMHIELTFLPFLEPKPGFRKLCNKMPMSVLAALVLVFLVCHLKNGFIQ